MTPKDGGSPPCTPVCSAVQRENRADLVKGGETVLGEAGEGPDGRAALTLHFEVRVEQPMRGPLRKRLFETAMTMANAEKREASEKGYESLISGTAFLRLSNADWVGSLTSKNKTSRSPGRTGEREVLPERGKAGAAEIEGFCGRRHGEKGRCPGLRTSSRGPFKSSCGDSSPFFSSSSRTSSIRRLPMRCRLPISL